LRYFLTKEQIRDAWYIYSDSLHTEWAEIEEDISSSIWAVEIVLSESKKRKMAS